MLCLKDIAHILYGIMMKELASCAIRIVNQNLELQLTKILVYHAIRNQIKL